MGRLTDEQLEFVLQSAILAPSADNLHRVRFKRDGDALSILSSEQGLPRQDSYRLVLDLLSLGAVVENVATAAGRFGFGTAASLLPEPSSPRLLTQIRFEQRDSDPDSTPLWPAIALRHSNRSLRFRGPALSGDERMRLARAIECFPDCSLDWLDQPERRRSVLDLMHRAESERFRNRLLHQEMFSSIRFEAGWRSSTTEGLPPGALGIEPPLQPFFRMLRHWPILRAANALGAHRMLGFRAAALPSRIAPDLALLAVKSLDNRSLFDAGRVLQRTWLGLTQMGRVAQPLPAAALYALPSASHDGIPHHLQLHLANRWRHELPDAIPVMVLRIGRARTPRVVAGRPPVDHFRID